MEILKLAISPFCQRHFAILTAELHDESFTGLIHTVQTGSAGLP
jgi:hypothetical protein